MKDQISQEMLSSVRCLVVDDEPTSSRVIQRILRNIGLRDVEIATHGDDALDELRMAQRSYDIVISDYMMPRMNGLELLQRIRVGEPGIHRDIIFAMLSGHSDRTLVAAAFGLDVDGFILKPTNPEDMWSRIAHWIVTERNVRSPAEYASVNISLPKQSSAVAGGKKGATGRPSVEPGDVPFGVELKSLDAVVAGSRTAQDIRTREGQLLIRRGQVIDQSKLNRLRGLTAIGELNQGILVEAD